MWLRKIRDQRGQALVEMAIVIPILLLVVFGIVEFGRIYYNQLNITSAARQGSRTAAVHTANNDYKTVENLAVNLGVLESDPDVLGAFVATSGTTVTFMPIDTDPKIEWTWTWGADTGTGNIEIARTVDAGGIPENVAVTIGYPIYIYAPLIDRAFGGDRVVNLQASVLMNIE